MSIIMNCGMSWEEGACRTFQIDEKNVMHEILNKRVQKDTTLNQTDKVVVLYACIW